MGMNFSVIGDRREIALKYWSPGFQNASTTELESSGFSPTVVSDFSASQSAALLGAYEMVVTVEVPDGRRLLCITNPNEPEITQENWAVQRWPCDRSIAVSSSAGKHKRFADRMSARAKSVRLQPSSLLVSFNGGIQESLPFSAEKCCCL